MFTNTEISMTHNDIFPTKSQQDINYDIPHLSTMNTRKEHIWGQTQNVMFTE